jgi:uncharacterized RDD family membrane protein YckC
MDRWAEGWQRRGESLLAVAIGSGFLWTATILASPNAKVSIWPAVWTCVGIALLGGYCMVAPGLERAPLPGRAAAKRARSHEQE